MEKWHTFWGFLFCLFFSNRCLDKGASTAQQLSATGPRDEMRNQINGRGSWHRWGPRAATVADRQDELMQYDVLRLSVSPSLPIVFPVLQEQHVPKHFVILTDNSSERCVSLNPCSLAHSPIRQITGRVFFYLISETDGQVHLLHLFYCIHGNIAKPGSSIVLQTTNSPVLLQSKMFC